MRAFINKLFLIVLSGLMLLINPPALADSNTKSPEIIKTSTNIIKQHQKISRESAVKVIGLEGGHGSGAYVKLNGQYFVITAKHVVGRDWLFLIEGSNKEESVVGQVVYRSPTKDIALLRVPRLKNRKPAKLQETEQKDMSIGEELVYSGYPSSYELLTSSGIVSGYENWGESVLVQGWAWPGSSGSAVFNEDGNVVGLVIAIGLERFRGSAQLIETLVYVVTIDKEEMKAIKKISK
tara:strand:- start:2226 stop:2936 length:711 start_codon:yes stop_codon:yes gene_type:complete